MTWAKMTGASPLSLMHAGRRTHRESAGCGRKSQSRRLMHGEGGNYNDTEQYCTTSECMINIIVH